MPAEEEIPTITLAASAFESTVEGLSDGHSISLPIAHVGIKGAERLRSYQRPLSGNSTAKMWRPAGAQNLGTSGLTLSSSVLRAFSREDLARADVLGQVDRKFIACLVRSSASEHHGCPSDPTEPLGSGRAGDEPILILIDQHAADERIRVERLLRSLCEEFIRDQVERRILLPPAASFISSSNAPPSQGSGMGTKILLTTSEAQALLGPRCGGVRRAFARWGFSFGDLTPALLNLEKEQQLTTYTQVNVYSVPDMIADKVRFQATSPSVDMLHPQPCMAFYFQLLSETELQDLTKNFLAQLEADGTEHWPPPDVVELNPVDETALNANTNWTRALRWCPQDILDLINSKACRGANGFLTLLPILNIFLALGAVMFNDPLDIEQCKRLVWQLSQTMLPFQCAHGRYVHTTISGGKSLLIDRNTYQARH